MNIYIMWYCISFMLWITVFSKSNEYGKINDIIMMWYGVVVVLILLIAYMTSTFN